MRFSALFAGAAVVALSTAALAGEEIVYAPAPEWVVEGKIPAADEEAGKPLRMMEQQVRLEDGQVWAFQDAAIALDSPQALTALGTLSAQWLPDKGDLIVHRVELLRDGEVVDLLDQGAKFEILRREQQLESRTLDGALTATMALPGARVGDTLRMSYSTTLSDQALGDGMQWTGMLVPEPVPLASGKVVASWPIDSQIGYKVIAQETLGELAERDGYRYFTVDLPTAKPKEIAFDAPVRFRMPPMLQIGNFADWTSVSTKMAPHFATEGLIEDVPAILTEIRTIEAATTNPLARAALATRLVQDEVSYLANGMDGGNYLPQSPAETWENRFGDCKAKSLLLVSMLREMGIESQVVLVSSELGDAVPSFLPAPGAFDHMIVHARIDGTSYWLDGTSSGTRLANIADVPRFRHALPLTENGAGLVEIPARPLAVPQEKVALTIDQSAGIAVPALYELRVEFSGISAAPWKALSQMAETEQRDDAIDAVAYNVLGVSQVAERSATFDDATGVATVTASGIMTTPWSSEQGRYKLDVPYQLAQDFSFDNDRARKEWRDLPVIVNGPYYRTRDLVILIPEDDGAFTMQGAEAIDTIIGGNTISSHSDLSSGKFRLEQEIRSSAWEIGADELSTVKRDTIRMKRSLPALAAPRDIRRAWDYRGADSAKLRPLQGVYATLIENAEADDVSPWINRAAFRAGTGDFAGSAEDLDRAIALQPSAELHLTRAESRWQMGDLDGALADAERAEALEAKGFSHGIRIALLGLLDRTDEILPLAEEYSLIAEDFDSGELQRAGALGWAGQPKEADAVFREILLASPENAQALNGICWNAGIWNLANESVLATCTLAVEKADNSIAARDSRALVLHRLGRYEEALADLDSVLAAEPNLHDSRYLRGIVRTKLGDKGGREDIAIALHASPKLAALYGAYGLDPVR